MERKYSQSVNYEKKLKSVMERMNVEKYDYDYGRKGCFVEFFYKGGFYRFEYSFEKAKSAGQKIEYVADLFAQLVLTLEDLSRMADRGIYDLQNWIEGMRALPQPETVDTCFLILGFNKRPTAEGLRARWKQLCKTNHPDVGGDPGYFMQLKDAYARASELTGEEI